MKKTIAKIKKWVLPLLKLIALWVSLKMKTNKVQKILLVAEFGQFGGTRTYFFSLIRFLHQQGYSVIVELTKKQQDDEILELLHTTGFSYFTKKYDFGLIVFNKKVWTKFNINPTKITVHALYHYMKIIKENHISSIITSVGTPERYLYFFLLPIKLIYVIHTVVEHKLEKVRRYWLKLNLSPKKKILTVSLFSKKAIQTYWNNQNIDFIYNYYPKPNITKFKNETDNINVLTIGSVEWYKNPEFWLKVAIEITIKNSNVHFYWLGNGADYVKFKELTKNDERIHFIGYTDNVDEWYNKCHIYFQPSIKESFGISVVGAMAYSIPCVVSGKEALPEIISDKVNGFVVNINDEVDAIKRITELIESKGLSKRIGLAGFNFYKQKFTYIQWKASTKKAFNNEISSNNTFCL